MKTLSMAKRQQQLLNSGFLDLNGSSRMEFAPMEFDALSTALANIAIDFATIARDKLNQKDKVASGKLADSIIPTQVSIMGTIYKVEINVANYYDFINKGVKGWADEKGGNSPYQFKRGRPSLKMMQEIRKWVIKEGLKGRGKENAHPKASIRDQARSRKISDSSSRTAYAISASVKKKGLKPTHFWSETCAEVESRMRKELSEALEIDIITNLTNIK